MSHTPGPWTYRFRTGGTHVEAEDGETVAIVGLSVDCGDVDADARLIAAAPELLAACELALGFVESQHEAGLDMSYELKQLRDAIAKATT